MSDIRYLTSIRSSLPRGSCIFRYLGTVRLITGYCNTSFTHVLSSCQINEWYTRTKMPSILICLRNGEPCFSCKLLKLQTFRNTHEASCIVTKNQDSTKSDHFVNQYHYMNLHIREVCRLSWMNSHLSNCLETISFQKVT